MSSPSRTLTSPAVSAPRTRRSGRGRSRHSSARDLASRARDLGLGGGGAAVGRRMRGVFHPARKSCLIALLAGIVLSIALGVPAATIAARESGRHDPGFVVIDEVAGQWIALLGSPRIGACAGGAGALSSLRYHQAVSRRASWKPARRLGHRLRRRGRGAVCFGSRLAAAAFCCRHLQDMGCYASDTFPIRDWKTSCPIRASTNCFPRRRCRWAKWS